jgi:hypothetical protein
MPLLKETHDVARGTDMPTDNVVVMLDATCPEELLTSPMPDGVWLRRETDAPNGWSQITVRGHRASVLAFIQENWGEDTVDDITEDGFSIEADPMMAQRRGL